MTTLERPAAANRTARLRSRHFLLLGIVVLVFVAGAIAWKHWPASGPFRVSTIDRAMAGDVKAIGDLDGDGFVDLVIGGMAGSEDMVWYRHPEWTRFRIAAASKEFTTDMQVADLDGDGDLDIVVADGEGPQNVQWLENPRPKQQATTGSWRRHPIGSHGGWVHDLSVADFDGDGRADVVTRKDSTKIWFSNAGGGFSERDLSGSVGRGEGLGVGDVDGDGDADLVANCAWFENPRGSRDAEWRRHPICKAWGEALTAAVADLDRDGAMEVVITGQHEPHKLAIFSHAGRPPQAEWREIVVDPRGGGHKINVGDFDLDGQLDIQTALEKHSVVIYFSARPAREFKKQVLPETGHNLRAADVGHDGDLDLFGAEYTGNPPARLWENTLSDRPPRWGTLPKGRWTRQHITNRHERTFGLAFADADRDGRLDIASGKYWYRNDGRSPKPWPRYPFPLGMQVCLALDLDGDRDADLIAQKDEGDIGIYWLERESSAGASWTAKKIGELPRASHDLGAQGYTSADLEPGDRAEIVMTSGAGVYYFVVPDDPSASRFRRVLISGESSDEGVAAADVDGDGRIDVVTTSGQTKRVLLHSNPGRPGEPWPTAPIGSLPRATYLDRVALGDFNRDGRVDVVVTEENGQDAGAATFWLEQPATPAGEWPRHLLVSQASTHSLDVGDIDADGDLDLVLGEHRGSRKVALWDNDGAGHFSPLILAGDLESHLGARLVDLDGDADLDLVNIAWDQPGDLVVLWNDAPKK